MEPDQYEFVFDVDGPIDPRNRVYVANEPCVEIIKEGRVKISPPPNGSLSIEQAQQILETITTRPVINSFKRVYNWKFRVGRDLTGFVPSTISDLTQSVFLRYVDGYEHIGVQIYENGDVLVPSQSDKSRSEHIIDEIVFGRYPEFDSEWRKRVRAPKCAEQCLAIREKVDDLVLRKVFDWLV